MINGHPLDRPGLLVAWAHTQLDGTAAPNSDVWSSGSAGKKRARRRHLRHQSPLNCGGVHTKYHLSMFGDDVLERGPFASPCLREGGIFCICGVSPNRRCGQLPPRRTSSMNSLFLVTSGAIPLLATWTSSSQHPGVPHRLLATRLRAEGLTATVGGQRVPPRWAWGPSVLLTTSYAKPPSCQRHNGALAEPKVIRILSRRQARALGLTVAQGRLQMAQGLRLIQGLVLLLYV